MGFFDWVKRDKCKKLILYQDQGIEFTFGSKVESIIPFAKVKIDRKKLNESCDVAKTLDDHLYRLCDLYRDAERDSDEYFRYQKKHERILELMSTFRLALSVKDKNSENEQEKVISKAVSDILDFLRNDPEYVPSESEPAISDNEKEVTKLKNELKRSNKKLRKCKDITAKYKMISVVSIAILLVVSPLVYFIIQFETKNILIEQQIIITESTVYGTIDDLIHSTTNIENQIDSSFDLFKPELEDSDEKKSEFIAELGKQNYQGIFAKDYRTTPISSYSYLMEPGPNCEFVAYAYLNTMDRGNGSKLESCNEISDVDIYLTSVYPSTGTDDYVFAVAKKLDLDMSDSHFDLVVTTAADLSKLSKEVQSKIDLEGIRFVLEDKQGQVVFDCDSNQCYVDYDSYADEQGKEFGAMSKPVIFNMEDYSEYPNHTIISLSKEKLIADITNSKLIDGWNLNVFYK